MSGLAEFGVWYSIGVICLILHTWLNPTDSKHFTVNNLLAVIFGAMLGPILIVVIIVISFVVFRDWWFEKDIGDKVLWERKVK